MTGSSRTPLLRHPLAIPALACLFAILLLAGRAEAQVTASPSQMMADQLVRLMHESLAGPSDPRPDQLQRAAILLDEALTLLPQDAALWRLRIELAERMDDPATQLRSLQRYLKLEPRDDAAQLQLVLLHLDRQQTLDGRLEKLEGILRSQGGRQLSKPLRSRLASYAAAAAHELGDDERHVAWLKQAVALDPTNIEAAQMAYQLALSRDAGAVQIGATTANLVVAAPADPGPRVRLGLLLTEQAAYRRARHQFETALTLAQGSLPLEAYGAWALSLAATGRAEEALTLLQQVEAPPQPSAPATDPGSGDGPADPTADPTAPVLPTELELIRLVLLDQPYQAEAAARSFARLRRAIEQGTGAGSPAAQRQLAWVAALVGRELHRVPEWVAALDADDPQVRRALGWYHLRREEMEQARAQLEPIAGTDPLAALALAQMTPDPAERLEALLSVVHRWPADIAGLLAARQLEAAGHDYQPTRAGNAIVSYMDRWPTHLWQPALAVSPWVSMQVEGPADVESLEPLTLRLTLTHSAQFPLALRSGQGAPTQAVINLSPSLGGMAAARVPPIVVDLGRQLTIEPGEVFGLDVRVDRGALGELILRHPTRTFSLDATVILGPQVTASGGLVAAPVGGLDRLRAISVRGEPATSANLDRWIQQVAAPDTLTQMRAAARLIQGLDELPAEMDTPDTRRRIADAVNAAYPDMDRLAQAWTTYLVADAGPEAATLFRRVTELAQRSDEPIVRIAHLAGTVDRPDAPALTAALRHTDPTIRRYATALHEGLTAEAQAATTAPAE